MCKFVIHFIMVFLTRFLTEMLKFFDDGVGCRCSQNNRERKNFPDHCVFIIKFFWFQPEEFNDEKRDDES